MANGSGKQALDLNVSVGLYKGTGTTDKAIIILPGGYHLLFLEERGYVGLQKSILLRVT
ncbi:MAG: hypothetical protein JRJ29_20835 [Deltaproteobacteria bacterium]|nr:hypothetical protein [Deltaproteobacteria bacterium]